MKVATIIGTRPELIKLSATLNKLDDNFNHTIIHTGQNYDYELNDIFYQDLGIRKPDYFLDCVDGQLGNTIGNIISKSFEILKRIQPDCLLVYGDTNSCLSVISAKRLKIPVFHMEAGNRCFDQRVPEELNRKIVDHLSDVNLTISEHARKYLLNEGLNPHLTLKIGSSLPEILKSQMEKINNSMILQKYNLENNKYIVLSLHREENVDDEENLKNLLEAMKEAMIQFKVKIVFTIHPRTLKRIAEFKLNHLVSEFIQTKPLGFSDYISLQQQSFCVISDSGTIWEESNILSFPAISPRVTHERPESMEEASVIFTGHKVTDILRGIKIATSKLPSTRAYDYTSTNVSGKVVSIISSYTEYINQNIWKK